MDETCAPWHAGEQAAQAHVGLPRERMDEIGRRALRAEMSQQHRDFFPRLPFVVLGGVARDGSPQATLLAGPAPGFVTALDPVTLRIEALPPIGDPLAALIEPGAAVAVLGIELATRRRNRENGVVAARDTRGFTVSVRQSFGNCPKYIQARVVVPWSHAPAPGAPRLSERLDPEMAALATAADTFFIATHVAAIRADGGADVSHRGGRPGFLRIADDGRTLTWPDFVGNYFFNTFGNLLVDPRAGLVIPDFSTGDLLHLVGRAAITWDGPEVDAFDGAQRLVSLRVEQALLRPAALPFRMQLVEPSPMLAGTGTWR